ncbi:TIGR04222 domain-containing membrane protein [Streptomyces sp. NPDC048332]|uniref:TIGR04222 domain-containing membrane protein n=1 Tax=Streptomyces sp. NPDC048332 TaxID=3154619 RepID=UPI00343C5068
MSIFALVLTLAVVVSSTLLIAGAGRARPRPDGVVHDLSEVAFLNGGPGRVVDTALAAMLEDGRLLVGGPGIVAVQRPVAHDPVERAVLQEQAAAPSGALHTLRNAVMRHPAVQEVGDGLAARGLLNVPGANRTRHRWAMAQAGACVLGLALSVMLTIVEFTAGGSLQETPVPFVAGVLPALLGGAVVGLVVASAARARITKAGRRAAAAFRIAHGHGTGAAHLVAVAGSRALGDPALRTHLVTAARMRPAGPPTPSHHSSDASGLLLVPTVWCAGSSPGDGGCGGSAGSSGGGGCGSGSSCGSGSGSGCGSASSCGSGSSCGSSSGSSCGSSS